MTITGRTSPSAKSLAAFDEAKAKSIREIWIQERNRHHARQRIAVLLGQPLFFLGTHASTEAEVWTLSLERTKTTLIFKGGRLCVDSVERLITTGNVVEA